MKPKIRIHKLPAALLAALVATTIPVRAATLTWDHDADGTSAGKLFGRLSGAAN